MRWEINNRSIINRHKVKQINYSRDRKWHKDLYLYICTQTVGSWIFPKLSDFMNVQSRMGFLFKKGKQ